VWNKYLSIFDSYDRISWKQQMVGGYSLCLISIISNKTICSMKVRWIPQHGKKTVWKSYYKMYNLTQNSNERTHLTYNILTTMTNIPCFKIIWLLFMIKMFNLFKYILLLGVSLYEYIQIVLLRTWGDQGCTICHNNTFGPSNPVINKPMRMCWHCWIEMYWPTSGYSSQCSLMPLCA
jgi:hypothetical protein